MENLSTNTWKAKACTVPSKYRIYLYRIKIDLREQPTLKKRFILSKVILYTEQIIP
ncbi:hypothetical protein GCM10023142_28000 [Anaerocolumna aminovalerica]